MTRRDLISHLKFYQALEPRAVDATENGDTIDLLGYDACTFMVNIGSFAANVDAGSYYIIGLQHGTASAAGVDAWTDVGAQNVLHSVIGSGGATSTITSGIWLTINSASMSGTVQQIGYLGDTTHRYVRLVLSIVLTPTSTLIGAVCVLGKPSVWPVVGVVGH